MTITSTHDRINGFIANWLLYLMHEGGEVLVDILLDKRSNLLAIDFDSLDVFVSGDWWFDSKKEVNKEFLQFDQFDSITILGIVFFKQ